ncbi:hypothetical protein [Devosia insulae]|uniref:hypothetical protein n=1 Tax=Devosia insulae TaxID=408174 RepID=UPI00114CF7FA|nr:hypothetical protein [Devosia insulae]
MKTVGTYPGKWYWDSVNRQFYERVIPDYAIPEAEFNSRFYFHTVPPEERERHDPAGVIKSIKSAEVHGRVFEPDNPANIVERDGLKFVNVRQNYYDALNERRSKRAE